MEKLKDGQPAALLPPVAANVELRQQSLDKYFRGHSAPFSIGPSHHRYRILRSFCKDPYLITHPLFRISRTSGTAAHSYNPISLRASALLEKSIGIPIPFEKVESSNLLHKSKRTNAVVVDLEGALVAVGGESGVLSVYDIDEAQVAMQRQQWRSSTCNVDPVVALEMGRSISTIAWHPLCRDELAVAFAFSSQVRIYDLSSVDSRAAPPKSVLEVSGMGKSCGHVSLAFSPQPSAKALYLLACSAEGHLRCWNLAKPSPHSLCNFLVSPSRAGGASNSLLGLVGCGESRVTAVSAAAVFTTFDLSRWHSLGFGSSSASEPLLLKQFRPLAAGEQLESAREGSEGQAVCAGSVRIWVVDCKRQRVLYSLEVAGPTLAPLPVVPPGVIPSLTPPPAPAPAPVPSAPSQSNSGSHELSFVQLRDLLGQRAHSRSHAQSSLRPHAVAVWSQDASSVFVVSVRGNQWAVQPADLRPWLDAFSVCCASEATGWRDVAQPQVSSGDFCYTLSGTVLEAAHGGRALRLSHPLPRSISQSGPRCDIRLEWVDSAVPLTVRRCDATVHLYQSDTLHLTMPYLGPDVDNGSPRVWIRLVAMPSPSSVWQAAPPPALQTWGFDVTRRASGVEINSSLECVTALATAPSLPLLIAGDAEERLWLLPFGDGGNKDAADAEDEDEDIYALDGQAARSKRQRQQ